MIKAIIITGDGTEHRYVANRLSERLGDHLVGVMIEIHSADAVSRSRLSGYLKRYGLIGTIERSITKVGRKLLRQSQKRQAALKSLLSQSGGSFAHRCDSIEVCSANNPKSLAWLKSRTPDYLFIYGTGIIRHKVLSIPRRESLNLHTGISPYYRGSGTVFWPLYNGEPHLVGVTVHECTPNVDGGKIYKRASVDLDPGDDPFTAFAKCVQKGAELYAGVAFDLVSGREIVSVPQNLSVGREYVFRDMTLWQDLKMNAMIRSGRLARIIKNNDKKFVEGP